MPQQSASFISHTLLELQPYKVATPGRSICTVGNRKIHHRCFVTFEYNTVKIQNFYHCVSHELKNGLLGKIFLLLLFFITKVKSIKKNRSHATDSMSCELMAQRN